MMKKNLLSMALLLAATTNAWSTNVAENILEETQEGNVTVQVQETPMQKYNVYTNGFWNNWFLSIGGSYVSDIERGASNWSDLFFDGHYGRFGFNLAVGKWFTPGLGMRLKLATLISERPTWNLNRSIDGFGSARADMMFNMSNLLCGYSETRVWNLSLLGGWGWIDRKSALDFGIHSNWKLGDRVNIFAEAAMFLADRHGKLLEIEKSYAKYWDLSVGLTFDLGKTGFRKSVDVDALMALNKSQLDALNASLAEVQENNAQLKKELAKAPKVVVQNKEIDKTVVNYKVFFNIGSARLASKKDIVNLEAVVNAVKNNNTQIRVTGYADSATGSAAYNQKLSEKRAETIAAELEKLGVERSKLIVEGKGGVATLKPASHNRCVCIEVE